MLQEVAEAGGGGRFGKYCCSFIRLSSSIRGLLLVAFNVDGCQGFTAVLFHYYTYLVDDNQLPIEVLQPTMPHWVPDDTAVADLAYQWLADRLVKARWQHFFPGCNRTSAASMQNFETEIV